MLFTIKTHIHLDSGVTETVTVDSLSGLSSLHGGKGTLSEQVFAGLHRERLPHKEQQLQVNHVEVWSGKDKLGLVPILHAGRGI